jgi:hypothetical protein
MSSTSSVSGARKKSHRAGIKYKARKEARALRKMAGIDTESVEDEDDYDFDETSTDGEHEEEGEEDEEVERETEVERKAEVEEEEERKAEVEEEEERETEVEREAEVERKVEEEEERETEVEREAEVEEERETKVERETEVEEEEERKTEEEEERKTEEEEERKTEEEEERKTEVEEEEEVEREGEREGEEAHERALDLEPPSLIYDSDEHEDSHEEIEAPKGLLDLDQTPADIEPGLSSSFTEAVVVCEEKAAVEAELCGERDTDTPKGAIFHPLSQLGFDKKDVPALTPDVVVTPQKKHPIKLLSLMRPKVL